MNRRRSRSILLVAAALASAPGAARAQAAPPSDAPAQAAPAPGAPAAPARRVLSLSEALRLARAQQPQLLLARSSTAAANARADEARAPLLPQLTATARYQRSKDNSASVADVTTGVTTTTGRGPNLFSLGASASQLLFDFGQTTGRWNAAKENAQAQHDSERAAAAQVVLNARTTYFTARAGKDLVDVARENLGNQEAHLRQIQGFVSAGTRPEIDLAQARTNRANAEVQLIQAQNTYETAKAQLNQAIGLDASTDYDVSDETLPPVESEDQPIEPLLAEALRNRPDVVSADEQIRAQALTAGAVRGAYFPTLGVAATATQSGNAIDSTTFNWTAGATLTWNLFQGGLTRAQEQEARANLESAQAQSVALRQQVRVDVEQARLAVRANKAALGAAGEALANAKEQLRLAEARYQAGAGSVIELGDAQVAYTTAAAQRVQAQYNLASSRAQLIRALGREVPDV
jgi:outer membrane protein